MLQIIKLEKSAVIFYVLFQQGVILLLDFNECFVPLLKFPQQSIYSYYVYFWCYRNYTNKMPISKYKNNVKHLLIQSVLKPYGLESSDWIRKTISHTEWLLLKSQIIKPERFRTFGLSECTATGTRFDLKGNLMFIFTLQWIWRDPKYRVKPGMEG